MSRNARIALLAAAVVVAVAAFVVVGTGGDEAEKTGASTTTSPAGPTATTGPAPPPEPKVPIIRLRDGEPVGGVKKLEFKSGSRARFVVASDTDQEVHVHGYDITRSVPAGRRTTIAFKADAEGVFEIEAHGTGREIATLKVVP